MRRVIGVASPFVVGVVCTQGGCSVGTGADPPPGCTPTAEVCDLADNGCDGQVDEDFR